MEKLEEKSPSASRNDIQVGRRIFHFANGAIVATAYASFFTHQRIVSLLGTVACLIYLFEQIRISYPKFFQNFNWLSNFFLRAEEELKESSMIPYVIAVLLSILTFPKTIALIAIYTLAIADPLSALVGIKYGKYRFVSGKSLEGSAAFFLATFFISLIILWTGETDFFLRTVGVSLGIAFLSALFEMIPIKIDDNLTIPLFVGFCSWLLCLLSGINIS